MHLSLFDQLKIQGENREIAATGAPSGVVSGDFLFSKRLAVSVRDQWDRCRIGVGSTRSGEVEDGYFAHGL